MIHPNLLQCSLRLGILTQVFRAYARRSAGAKSNDISCHFLPSLFGNQNGHFFFRTLSMNDTKLDLGGSRRRLMTTPKDLKRVRSDRPTMTRSSFRTHLVFVTSVFCLATVISVLRSLRSTRILVSHSYNIDDAPHIGTSKKHYQLDASLPTMYSTTQHRIRGQKSFILNDNENAHTNNNDFQHKGILRTSSDKHGKWMKIRWMPRKTELIVAGETIHKAGTNYSKYVEDTRLVIDVNHTALFPSTRPEDRRIEGQIDDNHLCQILRLLTAQDRLGDIFEKGTPPMVLNVTADCAFLNDKFSGQGDAILALYRLRMTTALAKVDFQFQCTNNDDKVDLSTNDAPTNDYLKDKSRKLRWVFPWFASFQSSSDDKDPWPYRGESPTQEQLCGLEANHESIPIDRMADQIREDVRKMALRLVGSRSKEPQRTHPLIPLDIKPWIPDIEMDDVIIHFPCNSDEYDWQAGTTREPSPVGVLQFNEYNKRINKNVRSIGIIRESSKSNLGNAHEAMCHRASSLLVEYLQHFYGKNRVSISIYEDDTLPLQYTRIAMAQQSFSSFSTFGMLPIIGTFGEGYFQPSTTTTYGIENIVNYSGFENIHLMNGNVLSLQEIDEMGLKDVLEWANQ